VMQGVRFPFSLGMGEGVRGWGWINVNRYR